MDILNKLLPDVPDPHFTPSHARRIQFPDGKVVELNRKERRQMKIYNKDLVKVK